MLRQESIQAAIDLAQELDRRGLGIVAVPGSEVATLVDASGCPIEKPAEFVNNIDELSRDYTPDVESIIRDSSMTVTDKDGAPISTPHAETLEEKVVALADCIGPHLAYARNTVKPAVNEYHKRVSDALNALPTSATYNPTLVKVDLPEPLQSPMILDAIGEFRGGTVMQDVKRANGPGLTGEEVIGHLTSGNAALDGEVGIWAQRLGADFFAMVWASAFSQVGMEGVQGRSFVSIVEDTETGADAALAVFLLARRLQDNPPEGTVSTLEEWRVTVGDLLVQAGIRMNHAVEDLQRAKGLQLLIKSVSADGQTIKVLAPVYDEFIAAGGHDAQIFGSVLSGERRVYVPGIVEKASEYVLLWERQNRLLTAALVNRRYADAQSLAIFKLEELLAENLSTYFPPEAFGGAVVDSINTPIVNTVIQEAKSYIGSLDADRLEDLWAVATHVIAKIVFGYTNAYEILVGINRACASNPDLPTGEAALLSTIDYVIDYITMTQLSVVDL